MGLPPPMTTGGIWSLSLMALFTVVAAALGPSSSGTLKAGELSSLHDNRGHLSGCKEAFAVPGLGLGGLL